MRTKFFCTNFLNTRRGPGHPGKIPGTSRIPLFETQGRQSFEGGHEVFGHHPFAWKTPTPPGGLRTPKLNLCALFSGLNKRTFKFLIKKSWIFTNAPCKTACLYNAPSMHTVEQSTFLDAKEGSKKFPRPFLFEMKLTL